MQTHIVERRKRKEEKLNVGRIQSGWSVQPTAKCQSLPQLFFCQANSKQQRCPTLLVVYCEGICSCTTSAEHTTADLSPLARHTLCSFSPLNTSLVSQHSLQVQHTTEPKLLKGPQSLPPCSQNKLYEAAVGAFLDPGAITTADSRARVCDQGCGLSRPTEED